MSVYTRAHASSSSVEVRLAPGEKKGKQRQSKGTDHALHRLGSGEFAFASASSPHLASGITNISTGLSSLLSSTFTSNTGDARDPFAVLRERATQKRRRLCLVSGNSTNFIILILLVTSVSLGST